MDLIREADLRTTIAVNLAVLKPYVKRESGLSAACTEEVLNAIMRAVDRCVIVRPSLVGYTVGRFGLTEPHPFPSLLTREERAELAALAERGLPKAI